MSTLFFLISFVAAIGMLPCLILVLVQMFKRGRSGLAITCLVLLCCGWGELIAFVYGWINAKAWNIQKIMLAWTVCWVVSIVAWLLWMATGAAIPWAGDSVSREPVPQDASSRLLDADASSRLLDAGVEAVSAYLAKSEAARMIAGGHYDNATVFRGGLTDKDGDQLGQFAVVARRLDASGEYLGLRFGLEDESARVNINALLAIDGVAEHEGRHLLMGLPGMPVEVADAILDWIDHDDEPREFGAEADYYSSALRPKPRNAPLQSIEELLSVRDVTPELLYGLDKNRNGFVDADEALAEEMPRENAGSNLGWSAYLTLYSKEQNATSAGGVFRARIIAYHDEDGPYVCREIIVDTSRSPSEVIALSTFPSAVPGPQLRAMLRLQRNSSSSAGTGVEAPIRDKATLRRVELATAISNWTMREVNWLDELRKLSTHLPVARDATVLRMTMQPSPSSGGRIDMHGVVRDPLVLVKMEEQLRKSHGRVQGRLQEHQGHQEPDHLWLFDETVIVLPPEIEELAQDNIPQVLEQLTKYESRSLPGNGEVAGSLYRAWLVELVEEVRMLNPSVNSSQPVARRGLYHTLLFQVRARGTLEQLKDFLFAFYQTDLLHQIRSLSITSVSKESQLDLAMAIEVLALELGGGSDGDEQAALEEFRRRSGRVSGRLEFQRLEDYELIVQRNLFDTAGNDEPNRPRIPAASDAPLERETRSPSKFFVPRDRLPKGLPSWFFGRDTDGDGQLTQAEYAPDASASSFKEFARYDVNGDGLLTPQEYLRGTNAANSEDATPDEVEKPATD